MIDEGYIKFQSHWTPGPPPSHPQLEELIAVRNRLFREGLVGVYADSGIGYGNVSLRVGAGASFIVSGTQTGEVPVCGPEHFCLVTSSDIPANSVTCTGPVEASSESMTHAMLYSCSPETRSVVHVHHLELWRWLHGKVPLSSPEVAYGTPDMAREVRRLFRESSLGRVKLMAMGGHEEGIISIGGGPEEAAALVMAWLGRWNAGGR